MTMDDRDDYRFYGGHHDGQLVPVPKPPPYVWDLTHVTKREVQEMLGDVPHYIGGHSSFETTSYRRDDLVRDGKHIIVYATPDMSGAQVVACEAYRVADELLTQLETSPVPSSEFDAIMALEELMDDCEAALRDLDQIDYYRRQEMAHKHPQAMARLSFRKAVQHRRGEA